MDHITPDTLKEYCERKKYNSRKYRFRIISELIGISEDEAKAVEKITRYLRYLFPVDEVGIEKESEYHKPISQMIYEQQQEKILKQKLI